ncbi:hypothetical protein, partial [Pseudomonas syringae group genomosp. 7]|uniref:hypothetical protein n=1 Tax=Pseudomonas syringae group genomosp. 7 TaxID=251699 RepID=UPI00376FF498
ALIHRNHRGFGHGFQLTFGDVRGPLDNDIGFRGQSGHLQIDPDQVLLVLHVSTPQRWRAV